MNRLLKIISAIVPFIAAEAIQYTLSSIIILIGNFVFMSDASFYYFSAGIIAVCGVIFVFWYRYETRQEIGGSLRKLLSVKYISLFLVLGVSCQLFFTGIMTLIKPLFAKAFSNYAEVLNNLTSGNEVVVLLLLVLIAPVTEELIFRGVTLHTANRHITFLGANILQAVLFGIYHGNIIQGIYAMLLGFLLGSVYYKFKTIFAPILLHMIINASSLLVRLIPEHIISYIIITVMGGILAAGALLLINPAHAVKLDHAGINDR